jgi:hypothetical protein
VRRALAAAGVGDGFDVGQVRRVDQHHVGAVRGQRAAADRAGEDAREVEHLHAFQRALASRSGGSGERAPHRRCGDGEQRLRGDGLRLARGVPLREAAQRGDHQARHRRGLLEVSASHCQHRLLGVRAFGGGRVEPQQRSAPSRWCAKLAWTRTQPSRCGTGRRTCPRAPARGRRC